MEISTLMSMLPEILRIFQAIIYFVMVWFFGSIIGKGFKINRFFASKLLLFGSGFLALVGGVALSNFITPFKNSFFSLIQMDVFINGLIISIIILVGLRFISYKKIHVMSDTGSLKDKINRLESIMANSKVPSISKKEAISKAEGFMDGYKANGIISKGNCIEVSLSKGKRKAKVLMDAYDGEIKNIFYDSKIDYLLGNPMRIGGIAIIAGVIMFSLINFRGFPESNVIETVSSMLGIPSEQLNNLFGNRDMPEGCIGPAQLFIKYGAKLSTLAEYKNEKIKNMIESSSGQKVVVMYNVEYNEKYYIMAITLPSDVEPESASGFQLISQANICSAMQDKFCSCAEIPT